MDRNVAGNLRIKKGRVFEAQIQFYSLGILIAKDYYLSHAYIVFFFPCPFRFSPSFSFSFLISFISFLFIYLFIFPWPLLEKGVFFHL